MNRALKILLGILFSVSLFYLFIKDVNEIPIQADSGFGHGEYEFLNRVIYIRDINNFLIDDEIRVSSDSMSTDLTLTVVDLHEPDVEGGSSFIVTRETISSELTLEANARIHFPRLQRALTSANYWWLIPCLVCSILALLIRAYRWKFFFTNYSKIHYASLWRSVCIGYMANNVLPFRIGEIVRAWVFGRKEGRRTSEVFGTIVLERIFDILSILILYVAFVFYFAIRGLVKLPREMIFGAWVMGAIAILALAFLIALKYRPGLTRNIINLILKPFPEKTAARVNHMIDEFVEGLWIFDSWRCILTTFGLSMVIWLVLAVAYLFVFYAVGIECNLTVSLFLIVALAFAVSIPSAPGFIGTFHWVGQQVLLMMGLTGNIEAYVLIAHLMAYIPVVILGFFYLSLENISWKEMRDNAMRVASETKSTEV
ncbi:flippase-like domain-containing protein [bacterium]|nr:flippase-like domain-containing protein [bacterium]